MNLDKIWCLFDLILILELAKVRYM